MAGESQAAPGNEPDPSVLTTEQMLRTVAEMGKLFDAKLDVVSQRLAAMDRATELLSSNVNRVPSQLTDAINHLRELVDEKFASIAKQFEERDTRSERESKDNKVAVDAAFAAQKEAASEQNKSNTLAISKSEAATSETINKLAELFRTTVGGLGDKIDDVKTRVAAVEATKQGSDAYGNTSREMSAANRSLIFGIVAAIGIAASIVLGILAATGK